MITKSYFVFEELHTVNRKKKIGSPFYSLALVITFTRVQVSVADIALNTVNYDNSMMLL